MMLLAIEVELVLLSISSGSQVLHLRPRATSWSEVDLVWHFSVKPLHESFTMRLKREVPAGLIAEELDIHAHGFSDLRHSGTATVDFPKYSSARRFGMEFCSHIGLQVILKSCQGDITSCQLMSSKWSGAILSCALCWFLFVGEKVLFRFKGLVGDEVTGRSTISWNDKFKGWWML